MDERISPLVAHTISRQETTWISSEKVKQWFEHKELQLQHQICQSS